jgi:(1->4)-alpha-D-glucan 1-alpha-D-glucosylmutase
LQSWDDGRVKLYVTYKTLGTRNAHRHVFLEGRYTTLKAVGPQHHHVTALSRDDGDTWTLSVAPRLPSRLSQSGEFPLGSRVWETSDLILPQGAPGKWSNVFTGETLEVLPHSGNLRLAELFSRFPVALLIGVT